MKKHQAYSLHIDSPCHEQWDAMLQVRNGKYCLHCAKTVIDCTNLSDSEIHAVIQQQRANGKSSFCGRFKNKQLNRPLVLPQQKHRSYFALPVLVAGVLTMITAENTFAQDVPANMKCEQKNVPQAQNTTNNSNTPKKQVLLPVVPDSISIVGYVKDGSWNGLQGATVNVVGTTFQTTTREDGSFVINDVPKGSYTLKITRSGYEARTVYYNTLSGGVASYVLAANRDFYDYGDDEVMGLMPAD
ncbi:MAG: carboxypeptidase-like regulatory domain-containing protein [Bacteriodetes bacterium]|nr:carboxypeptidase-like regulatory domain-containing protein [Bacteroidota bacterium]